jgi:cobalamin synthase
MRTWKRPPTPALALAALLLLAIALFFTRGIGEVMVLAVGSLLVMSYLARRYVYTHLGGQYPRHGDRMD